MYQKTVAEPRTVTAVEFSHPTVDQPIAAGAFGSGIAAGRVQFLAPLPATEQPARHGN